MASARLRININISSATDDQIIDIQNWADLNRTEALRLLISTGHYVLKAMKAGQQVYIHEGKRDTRLMPYW